MFHLVLKSQLVLWVILVSPLFFLANKCCFRIISIITFFRKTLLWHNPQHMTPQNKTKLSFFLSYLDDIHVQILNIFVICVCIHTIWHVYICIYTYISHLCLVPLPLSVYVTFPPLYLIARWFLLLDLHYLAQSKCKGDTPRIFAV